MKRNTRKKITSWVQFFTNPRLILCIVIAWIITNGWSYVAFGIGNFYDIEWLTAVSGAYIAFLWLPVSPEKIITIAIAIYLLRKLFPKDKKTLLILKRFRKKACSIFSRLNTKNK
ncbi:MAG: hypothetical protein IKK47_05185 [Ruminococcus sp.]|nr:hypothetical protein [Ruminococcus sp.]